MHKGPWKRIQLQRSVGLAKKAALHASAMGTSAGFFGITYQGASNGLASITLSIFNVDHPDDRAWAKVCFDFVVGPSGAMTKAHVPNWLAKFYRYREEGPTQSGSYVHQFPDSEKQFVLSIFGDADDATISFTDLMDALQEAQANFVEPSAPLEYGSAAVLRSDKAKHTRCIQHPQQQFRKPMTTSQEVGWELYSSFADVPPANRPFALRTSATTQFADAMEKQTWGRSIGGEFSAYAMRKLVEFGGQGMGV